MTRRFLRALARGVAGALLFAQLAVAAYACPGLDAVARDADAAAAPAAPMANCDDMVGAMDAAAANLCAEHCKAGQQSDHAGTLSVPAAARTALYATVPVPVTAPPPRPAAASLSALVAASPPHAIAHCVYRI